MVKAVKFLIGLSAAFLLFLIVFDYVKDFRNAYEDEFTSTYSAPGEEVAIEIPQGFIR